MSTPPPQKPQGATPPSRSLGSTSTAAPTLGPPPKRQGTNMPSPSIDTPDPKPEGTPPSPARKSDGIDVDKQYLLRTETINRIYQTALEYQHVVIGSPAATGKSSLLTILKLGLRKKKNPESEAAKIITFKTLDIGLAPLLDNLYSSGFPKTDEGLEALENTWLLIDDAQNAYKKEYDPLWQIVVKHVANCDTKNKLFVVIAATYDLATPESPVNFHDLHHIDPNICENEAKQLIGMHLEHWGFGGWTKYSNTLLGLSELTGRHDMPGPDPTRHPDPFHIGIIMASMRLLEDIKKYPGMSQTTLTEDYALAQLRDVSFACSLHRCFKMREGTVTKEVKDSLLRALLSPAAVNEKADHLVIDGNPASIGPLIRAGVVTKQGRFSCAAAQWYYNRYCFPNRAEEAPKTLRDLIIKAVGSMSAKRLQDSVQAGFPKEAAFQHLFNETMSLNLPSTSVVIPELNTRVVNSQDPLAQPVTGELDFYVNGNRQWCIEIDRLGDQIGRHLGRFCGENGKYRKVATKDYYVVDCRGPKVGGGIGLEHPHRCTLYFAKDFSTCRCEVKGYPGVDIDLEN